MDGLVGGPATDRMTGLQLPDSWQRALKDEVSADYMAALIGFLAAEKDAGRVSYPADSVWFRALELTPLEQVKVVILGQDPYHGPGQAHGLSFSVPPGVRPPPSLANIYKELEADLGIARVRHGFLEHWARQGVLLLNSVLTVEQAKAASHRKKGWERFTDAVVRAVSEKEEPVVFMLWGAYAQSKAASVNADRHLILQAAHPSPLSAHNGFLGCKHFSQCNAFLISKGQSPIDWELPDAV
nr:uracil-DNA glycosylase [uncultured Sphingorhabdus sp.]